LKGERKFALFASGRARRGPGGRQQTPTAVRSRRRAALRACPQDEARPMFDLVHKHKRIAQFILALIMIPFAFFGVDYYFRTGDTAG
jgi:hypothetical protein